MSRCIADVVVGQPEAALAGYRAGGAATPEATEAMLRWTRIYRAEAAFADMGCEERWQARQVLSRPLWEEFEVWLKLQRTQVPDGTKIAEAIDYSLNAWTALTLHLDDGAVAIGRVEMWRGGRRSGLSVSAPFVWRCPSNLAVAPFPHSPHR